MQYRLFGKTGEMVSILGLGTMRLPVINDNPANIDITKAISLLRYGIDNGINYIDTAFTYHKQESEKIVGLLLKDGYRSKVKIATKIPVWQMEKSSDFEKIFNLQLKRMNTDYIDFYLLHGVNRLKWDKALRLDVLNSITKKKKEGFIGHIGFSFHGDLVLFKEITSYFEEWEFCQLLLNYVVDNIDNGIDELKIANSLGLGVSVMEPLLGGRLALLPSHIKKYFPSSIKPVEAAFSWLWNKNEIGVILSGMNNIDQLKENISIASNFSSETISPSLLSDLQIVANSFIKSSLVNCSGCNYCLPCSQGIIISKVFEIYNRSAYDLTAKHEYRNLKIDASYCVRCGLCTQKCPQEISIPDILHEIHTDFYKTKW